MNNELTGIADELEAEALNYEGDFADTVKGCVEALREIAASPASQPVAPEAAHAQQEAAPMYQAQFDGEYGSSVWRDVTEAAFHTFMPKHRRIVYAAPTTVPDHSEREAANAGGMPVDLIHDFRDAINIAHHRADHAGDTTRMKRWKEVSRRLEAYVRTINAPATVPDHSEREAANVGGLRHAVEDALREENRGASGRLILDFHAEQALRYALSQSPATIAAGQEAANAKDAALANRVRDLIADHVADNWPMVRYHLEEVERKLRAINADYLLGQDSAAMAAVGAAGQEGGDK